MTDRPSVERRRPEVGAGTPLGDRTAMQLELRERIEAGTYEVEPGLVAEAMLRRMSAVFVSRQAVDRDAVRPDQREPAPGFDLA